MGIIGFSSGVTGRQSNIDRMVLAILEGSGSDFEHVKLTDLTYSPCKGCVERCAAPQVCQLEDDLQPYYQKIKDADAVVVGSSVSFDNLNGLTFSFLERFFGYRHVTSAIRNKPFVLALTAQRSTENAKQVFLRRTATAFMVNVLDVVEYHSGVPPCLVCGRHTECRIGGLYRVHGEEALTMEVTPEKFRAWEDDPATVAAVQAAAEKLRNP
jgi:multimeric flavodoxin WrbA